MRRRTRRGRSGRRGLGLSSRAVLVVRCSLLVTEGQGMSERVKHFTELRVWRIAHQLFLDLCKDLEGARTSPPASVIAEQNVDEVEWGFSLLVVNLLSCSSSSHEFRSAFYAVE